MSHVDEGQLHAYLDRQAAAGAAGEAGAGAGAEGGAGAAEPETQLIERHLLECTECRARLEEARRLRDRAADILRAAGPARIPAPPFEEVLARSRREGTRRRIVRLSRLQTLAWAATVVLAVGVGWYARGSLRRIPQQSTPAVAIPRERDQVGAGKISSELTEVADSRRLVAEAESEAPAARALADVDTRAEAAFKTDAPTSERTPALAPAPAVPQAVVTANATAEQRRLRRARGEVLEAGVAQARAEQQVAAIATNLRSKAEGWTEVNEATAQAFLAGPVAVVEDFPVVTYATRVADGRRAVRVRQDLGSAGLLELVQETLGGFALAEAQERDRQRAAEERLRATDDRLRAADARLRAADEIDSVERKDSLSTVSVRRGNYLITIRAPISMDSLRALLKRIR